MGDPPARRHRLRLSDEENMTLNSVKNASVGLPRIRSSSLAPHQLYRPKEAPSGKLSTLPPSSPLPSSPKAPHLDFAMRGNDDPFGFLATERKLKQGRPRNILQPKRIDQNTSWAAPVDSGKITRAHIDTSNSDSERKAFATPKRRKDTGSPPCVTNTLIDRDQIKCAPQEQKVHTPKHDSLGSSSVSPQKMMTRKKVTRTNKRLRAESDNVVSMDEGLAGDDAEFMHRDGRSAPTTDELLSRLPHRPVRRPVRKKPKKDIQTEAPMKKATCRRREVIKRRSGKVGSSGEVINVREGESFVLDDDEREKYALERAERLEYFRNLDAYEMAQENVYII